MFRLLGALSISLLLLASSNLKAAPRPDDKPGGPALVGQAKSMNDLIGIARAMVQNIGGDEVAKEFENGLLRELDPKKLPGVDPKRPFGVYGFVASKLEDCRGIVLVPVVSEKDFLDMLDAERFPYAKGKEEGIFDVQVPADIPIPISFRFHKEYVYFAFGGSNVLDKKAILDPKDVINEKEKAAAIVSLRVDRIPMDARKAMVAILREQTEQLLEQVPEEEGRDILQSVQKLGLRWLKMFFDEGKELTLRLDADPKTGDVHLDIVVEGMPKSSLSETFAQRKPTTNAFASIAGDDYAQRVFIKAPFFADEAREALTRLVDFGGKMITREAARGNAPPEVLQLIEAVGKSLKANISAGEMDLAAALRGPNKDGFYTAVAAVHCREGAQLEKAIRDVVKIMPAREQAFFKFDAGKIGDVKVHEIDLSAEAADPAIKIFGKGQTAYFCFAKDALYVTYGPDGMKLLKEALESKPGPAAVLDTNANPKKMADVMKKLLPEDGPNVSFALGWIESMTTSLRVTVDGGDKLKVRVTYNVGTIMHFFGRSVGAKAKPVAPPAAK